jgi:peptidoglycan/xylan/chitin deacetylase (PgdA/CDA1 family)
LSLHRFAVPDLCVTGHDPLLLGKSLDRLRRERFNLVSLDEAVTLLHVPSADLRRTVAFTIDDGYSDIALVAADVFAAFDCPVTVFLSTGFVDGRLWHWWDQVEYICLSTEKEQLDIGLGAEAHTLELSNKERRERAAKLLWEKCKQISEQTKLEFIAQLAADAEVEVPSSPPAQYRALSWSDVRGLERRGFSFGPHGVSHPVLARTTARDSARQIAESWEVVKSKTEHPVPIFAYPNGLPGDFGDREIDQLVRSSLVAAVTSIAGYARRDDLKGSPQGCYRIPRFGYPEDPTRVCFVASGLEQIARYLRR